MQTTKQQQMPVWLSRVLIVGLGAIFVLLPVHAFVSTWGGTAIGPLWLWKSWKEIVLALLAMVTLGWVLSNTAVRQLIFKDRLAQYAAALFILSLLVGVAHFETGISAISAGLAMNLRYLAIAFLAYILFRFNSKSWLSIKKNITKYLIAAAAIVAFLGLLQVTIIPRMFLASFGYDAITTIAPYLLIDDNPNALRAFATLRGPNDFGAFLILPLLLSLLVIRRLWWRIPTAVLIIAGLLASGSRSAWLGALIAIVALVVLEYGRALTRSRRAMLVGVASLVTLMVIGVAALTVPALRLAIFHSSPGDVSLIEGSTSQHWIATSSGIERVIEQPLGCGTGCAGPASYYSDSPKISENYYVQIAEEIGIIGLFLWLMVAWVVMKRLFQQKSDPFARALLASFIGLSAIGFWLHVWSDDPLSLTWWLLAGAAIGYNESQQWKKSKSSSRSKTSSSS